VGPVDRVGTVVDGATVGKPRHCQNGDVSTAAFSFERVSVSFGDATVLRAILTGSNVPP
jgi:hypothetical protein